MTLFFDILMALFVILCVYAMAVLAGRQHRSLTGRLNRHDRKRIARNRRKRRKQRLARTRR